MHPKKNIPNLIKACEISYRHRSDFRVDIVGIGKKTDEYKNIAKQASLENVLHFLGYKNKKDIAALMQNSDFFVLPSRYETFGCVVAESLFCGLPVVATNVGSLPEVINDSNGVLVESDNSPALAEKMEWMMDNCNTYDRGKISRDARKKYSYDAIGRQLTAIYEKVLAERMNNG